MAQTHIQREEIHDASGDQHRHRRQIVRDTGRGRQLTLARIVNMIWLLFGVLETFIGLRVFLKLIAANPNNTFAAFIYNTSELFLRPFFGLIGDPATTEGAVLEISSIIAMVVYMLLAWVITRLLWIVFYSPSKRVVSTFEERE